ncbi:nuclear transport factor 2 family protein [Lentzea sp. NPDC060358]|uniref:nuclear transport factor 2 family protein n=1 Tax=Lentzea sp. NPDC060358 TaxID=3347103 RepID=UPI003648DEAE
MRHHAEAFFAATESKSPEVLEPHLAPDVVMEVPLTVHGALAPVDTVTGKQALLDWVRTGAVTFDRIRWRDLEFSTAGETVFAECHGDMTVAGTGEPYRNRYVFRFDVRDGLIRRIREYSNPVAVARLLERPGA